MPVGGYDMLKARMSQGRAQRQQQEQGKYPKFTYPKNRIHQGNDAPNGMLPSTAQVRFVGTNIDDVFAWAQSHALVVGTNSNTGEPIKNWFVCLNPDDDNPDDCPACKAGVERKQRFWCNIIWRNAPVWQMNQWGDPDKSKTILGYEDQLVVWNTGSSMFSILQEVQDEFGDVVDRDIRLKIEIKGPYTIWSLAARQPDVSELSDADKALADKRYDLRQLIKPMAYNDMAALVPGASPRQEDAEEEAAQSFTGMPFQNKKNIYAEDDSPAEQVNSPLARPRN
jgi:hypothetical protein